MGNVDFICIANHIVICNREVPKDIDGDLFLLMDEETDELVSYKADDSDEERPILFALQADIMRFQSYLKMENPQIKLKQFKIHDVDSSYSLYIDPNTIPCNSFVKEYINAINNNQEYGRLLETDELFYTSSTEIISHLFDNDNVIVAEIAIDLMYSFITLYHRILKVLSKSEANEELANALKNMIGGAE